MSSDAKEFLPSPGVRFESGFLRRLEMLAQRTALARELREGAGVPSRPGGGPEFVGYRPYARGDDLRSLDWDLLARSHRPWVRVTRRDAGERWLVRVDTSRSMGVGPPGKLQRAAEVAAGIAALGAKKGAEVRVVAGARSEATVRRRADIVRLLAFLEGLRAEGAAGPPANDRILAQVSRVFLIGDLRDFGPETALSLRSSGRTLSVIQILAPVEVAPPRAGSVEWWDPERGERLVLALDARTSDAYATELSLEIERWRSLCARAGVPYGCFSSAQGFEEILEKSRGV